MKKINEKNFVHLALFQLFYLILVILFGAYVRASGSGAGCGSHWPLCNGNAIPQTNEIKTIIEYTHRITSSISLPIAMIILYLSRKIFSHHKIVIKAALWTFIFLIIEALLGAGLVLFEHVAENKSVYRAFSMSLHLVNTFFLLASSTLCWVTAKKSPKYQIKLIPNKAIIFGFLTLLFISVSGTITALGDTLFPVKNSYEALSQALVSTEHLFIKLRIYHPFIAVLGSIYFLYIVIDQQNNRKVKILVSQLITLVLSQLILGLINIKLFAPIWLQIIHLFFADLIWIVFVVFALETSIKKAVDPKANNFGINR